MADVQKDHDLLIRLDENVRTLMREFKEFKENLATRVDDLEENRLRKTSFDIYVESQRKETITHAERLDKVEDKLSAYSGGLFTLQLVLGVAMWYFK